MSRSMHPPLQHVPYAAAAIVLLTAHLLWSNPTTPMQLVVIAYVVGLAAILAGAGPAWLAHGGRDEEPSNG